jgi:hypothetical protein
VRPEVNRHARGDRLGHLGRLIAHGHD